MVAVGISSRKAYLSDGDCLLLLLQFVSTEIRYWVIGLSFTFLLRHVGRIRASRVGLTFDHDNVQKDFSSFFVGQVRFIKDFSAALVRCRESFVQAMPPP